MSTSRDAVAGPATVAALLGDQAFASELAELDRLRAEERRRVREIRHLLDLRSDLIGYELRRRIVGVLDDHPEGMTRRELVADLGMERPTRLLEHALADLVAQGVVEKASAVRPEARGQSRRHVIFGVTVLARAMPTHRLERALGRPDLPRRSTAGRKLRVIQGGKPDAQQADVEVT